MPRSSLSRMCVLMGLPPMFFSSNSKYNTVPSALAARSERPSGDLKNDKSGSVRQTLRHKHTDMHKQVESINTCTYQHATHTVSLIAWLITKCHHTLWKNIADKVIRLRIETEPYANHRASPTTHKSTHTHPYHEISITPCEKISPTRYFGRGLELNQMLMLASSEPTAQILNRVLGSSLAAQMCGL